MAKDKEAPCIYVIRHLKFGFLTHSYDGCGGPQLEFTYYPNDKSAFRRNSYRTPEWFPTENEAKEHLNWIQNCVGEDSELYDCCVFKLYQDIYTQNREAYKQYEANRLVNPT